MSIAFEVLGEPGRDNALLVRVDSGQATAWLLFDCGEGCLSGLGLSEIQSIDALFFSHLHMDHVAGFDSFFRACYNRLTKHNIIYGPERTGRILQHRFQGYWWNLLDGQNAAWRVQDIAANGQAKTTRYELAEAFAVAHDEGTMLPAPEDNPHDTGEHTGAYRIVNAPDYTVSCLALSHYGPSLAYVVREKPRVNVDTARLKSLGLRPGAWLKTLKECAPMSDFGDGTPPALNANGPTPYFGGGPRTIARPLKSKGNRTRFVTCGANCLLPHRATRWRT